MPLTAIRHGDPTRSQTPTRDDALAASASTVIGGSIGRYAALGRPGVTAATLVLSLALTLNYALSVLLRGHCIRAGWSSPDDMWHMCYSDVAVSYGASGLSMRTFPYGASSPLGEPPGTGLVMWLIAQVAPGGDVAIPTSLMTAWFFALWAMLAVVATIFALALLAQAMPARRWKLAHWAMSPVVALVALVSFDALAVALAFGGLALWGRRRVFAGGALLGLALTMRLTPIWLLIALGLVCFRSGRLRAFGLFAGAALVSFGVLVGGLVAIVGTSAIGAWTGWSGQGASYGSLMYLPTLAGSAWLSDITTIVASVGWVFAIGIGAIVALSLPRRPGVAEVALIMIVVAAVTAKSVPVQASLWLVPLLALIGVPWRVHLTWAGVEALYFGAVWLNIAAASAADRGLPGGWYGLFLVLRLLTWGWLAWTVWNRARGRTALGWELGPESTRAQSRAAEIDEVAGPMAGQPDRIVLRIV